MQQHKQKKAIIIKKTLISAGAVAFLYLIIFAMLLAFQGERNTSFNGQIQEGENYASQGKIALAIEHFRKIAKEYPNNYYVHMKLGELYKTANEVDNAKIELFQAIQLAPDSVEAHSKMANLYINLGELDLAEKVMEQLDESKRGNKIAKGEFFLKVSNSYKSPQDRLIVLKKAYRYLAETDSKSLKTIEGKICNTYIGIADIYLTQNNLNEAVRNLKLALKYDECSKVYNKLASVYIKKDDQKSLFYIKKSMEIDKTDENLAFGRDFFIELGKSFYANNKKYFAEYAFQRAKAINPQNNIPYYEDKLLLVNILSTQFNEDESGNYIMPGLCFKITNLSKDEIGYLNAKVVFMNGKELISESEKLIATPAQPFSADSVTSSIDIFSKKPLDSFIDLSNISAKIMISLKKPDEWKLYRVVSLKKS